MINVFHKEGKWEIWIDTEGGERDGLCIGTSADIKEALKQAESELLIASTAVHLYSAANEKGFKLPDVTLINPTFPVPAEPEPASDPCPF